MNHKNQLNAEDHKLRHALQIAHDEEEFSLSPRAEALFLEGLKKLETPTNNRRARLKPLARIALVTILLAVLLVGGVVAHKIHVYQLSITSLADRSSVVLIDEDAPQPVELPADCLLPNYIPYGFIAVGYQDLHDVAIIEYKKPDTLSIFYYIYKHSNTLDTTNTPTTENTNTEINGQPALLSVDGDLNILSWSVGNQIYSIESRASVDEILKIAESVKEGNLS